MSGCLIRKCEDLFKHALVRVCMSLCDCVHREINLSTLTFVCVCVCVCVSVCVAG